MSKSYIIKTKKSKIEKFLGRKLANNKIVIGWDVSMYNTGVAIAKTTSYYFTLEVAKVLKVPKPTKSHPVSFNDTFNIFIDEVDNFKNNIISNFNINANLIEDCHYKINANTLKKLARFSAIIYDRFHNIVDYIDFKGVSHLRKVTGFNKYKKKGKDLKKQIVEYVNKALGTKIKDDNIADATMLVFYALIKLKEEE